MLFRSPTTMTSNFRLFAGFTNFTENLWLSHFSAMEPVGTLASSLIVLTLSLLVRVEREVLAGNEALATDDAGENGDRKAHVSRDDKGGDADRETAASPVETRVADAERLEETPSAMEQVHPQSDVCRDVEKGDGNT